MFLLLRASALYSGAIGSLALLIPRTAAAGLKPDMSPFDVFTTRTIGATLVGIAVANWSSTPRSGILLANLVLHTALGGIDAAAIADGTIGRESWRGVAVHGALATAFGWALLGHRRPSDTA